MPTNPLQPLLDKLNETKDKADEVYSAVCEVVDAANTAKTAAGTVKTAVCTVRDAIQSIIDQGGTTHSESMDPAQTDIWSLQSALVTANNKMATAIAKTSEVYDLAQESEDLM